MSSKGSNWTRRRSKHRDECYSKKTVLPPLPYTSEPDSGTFFPRRRKHRTRTIPTTDRTHPDVRCKNVLGCRNRDRKSAFCDAVARRLRTKPNIRTNQTRASSYPCCWCRLRCRWRWRRSKCFESTAFWFRCRTRRNRETRKSSNLVPFRRSRNASPRPFRSIRHRAIGSRCMFGGESPFRCRRTSSRKTKTPSQTKKRSAELDKSGLARPSLANMNGTGNEPKGPDLHSPRSKQDKTTTLTTANMNPQIRRVRIPLDPPIRKNDVELGIDFRRSKTLSIATTFPIGCRRRVRCYIGQFGVAPRRCTCVDDVATFRRRRTFLSRTTRTTIASKRPGSHCNALFGRRRPRCRCDFVDDS